MKLKISLGNPLKPILDILKNFTKSKSKKQIVLDSLIVFFFAATFFSIPACSFRPVLNYVTWVFTAIFVILILLSFAFYTPFRLYYYSLFLILFCFSALISSLLNGMRGFTFTSFLLVFLSFIIFSYCKENKSIVTTLFLAIYISLICFAIFFFLSYWDSFSTLQFDRLGSLFGNENEVAIFFGFGFLISAYLILYAKNLWNKLLSFIIMCLFILLGISSGSKIFFFVVAVIFVALTFLFFGKKKWWVSLIVLGVISVFFIIILSLPFAATITNRLISFVNTFFDISADTQNSTDISSISRLYMFLDGIEMFFRKPLFGFGIEGFSIFGGLKPVWSHNHFSESLANFGLVGSFFFNYGIPLSILGFIRKKDQKLTLYFLCIIFFIVLMFSVAFFTQKLYAFIIGIVVSQLTDGKPLFSLPVFSKKFIEKRKAV